MFEGVSSAEAKLNGSKLSREERIRAMKEQREQKEERPVSTAEPMMSGQFFIAALGKANFQAELKGVISALKSRREERRAAPSSYTSLVSTTPPLAER